MIRRANAVLILIVMTSLVVLAGPPSTRQEVLAQVQEDGAADAKRGQRAGREELVAIYQNEANAAHLTMREVAQVYTVAYDEAVKRAPWWKKLPPEAGWLAATALLILFFSKELLKSLITFLSHKIAAAIYDRFSGSRLFRTKALRKFRDQLGEKYHQIFLPFRPDEPLEMKDVYVPLKVKGTSGIELVDATAVLRKHRLTMILGAPGSGKSMLFRSLAFAYSRQKRNELFDRIPVLLELSRLNDSSLTILEHIVDVFRLNGFPNAAPFVRTALEDGRLELLLDGLDEVSTLNRAVVVQAITDFVDEFDKATVAITCRTQVYKEQFNSIVDITLEVVEFNDQQINQYLQAWQRQMPPGKSIEQLLQTLRNTPNIMALARNPLLLSIVAFLYTRPNFVLPQSRTQFYSEAVRALFAPKPGVKYKFEESDKKLVLQHLALTNQERSTENRQDRRAVDRVTVLKEVSKVLSDLNQDVKEAPAVIGEIVDRTGFLLAIDGGSAYQFAHLTLQEYFAAKAMQSMPDELLERFEMDPYTWR